MVDNRMKKWAALQGYTYASLAAALGLSKASVSMKINGLVAWQQRDLVRLNELFGLSSDFVLGLDVEEVTHAA